MKSYSKKRYAKGASIGIAFSYVPGTPRRGRFLKRRPEGPPGRGLLHAGPAACPAGGRRPAGYSARQILLSWSTFMNRPPCTVRCWKPIILAVLVSYQSVMGTRVSETL